MFTKCPECKAVFRVSAEQLEVAEGLVRCGLCDVVFNGKEYLQEESDNASSEEDLTAVEQYDEGQGTDAVGFLLEEDTSTSASLDEEDGAETNAEIIPGLIRDDFGGPLGASNSALHVALWTIAAVSMMLFFLGQITYWQKVEILPTTWVEKFCQPLGCGSPKVQDINNIKILNRNIYTHPNVENALMITTSFVSVQSQPFPLMQVALLDIQGRILAVRRFKPQDYLINKDLKGTSMRANEPVGARLEVIDPGSKVIAYEFDFFTSE